MPYITRDDGERFVIPSYRDVLSAKKPALLKKEVTLLSGNYGEYITLQRKNIDQYEAAFSPDSGYLLGETIWHQFKRPKDLIYCEALPNGIDAILVIVKGGSVYLDGSFPIDSIPDELVVFRTQQNSFEIYIYGNIPLSQHPEEGKFTLDESSVKSFTVLTEPVFPKLPTLKSFQLRLVDIVLRAQGIGVFPVRKAIGALALVGLVWMAITYFSTSKKELPTVLIGVVNPYQLYINMLTSPAPTTEIETVTTQINRLYTIPGWQPTTMEYAMGQLKANVQSPGMKTSVLFDWAAVNSAKLQITSDGIYLFLPVVTASRVPPTTISPLNQVIAELLDRIATVIPGNNLTLGTSLDRGRFSEVQVTIAFNQLTVNTVNLLAEQLRGLPLILTKINVTANNGTLSGNIILKALGS